MTERQDVHNSSVPALCFACEARHRGVCGALDWDQLVSLARTSTKKTLRTGSELIGDAQSIEGYSNILSGVVKLAKCLPDVRDVHPRRASLFRRFGTVVFDKTGTLTTAVRRWSPYPIWATRKSASPSHWRARSGTRFLVRSPRRIPTFQTLSDWTR